MLRYIAFAVGSGLLAGLFSTPAFAEKVPSSPEELREIATHIVVGRVDQVFTRQEKSNNYAYTRYVAEVRVDKLEKGEGFKQGELMYVRYWTKYWIGKGNPPPDTSGHSGLPKERQVLRIYASRNAYDGFGHTKDGGFNVVGRNGFEAMEEKANSRPSK